MMSTAAQIIAAASTTSAAAVVVAQSAATDGITPTTGWAGGIIAGGVAVFTYLDRRTRRDQSDAARLRREDDAIVRDELAAARLEIRRLNDRIADILAGGPDTGKT